MARLPYVSREDLSVEERAVFDEHERDRGAPPMHIHRAIANAPNLLRRFSAMALSCATIPASIPGCASSP